MKSFCAILLLVLLGFNCVWAQNLECEGAEISIPLVGYSAGDIQWQFSSDLNSWEKLLGETTSMLVYTLKEPGYFRAVVNAGSCEYISDTIFIDIEYAYAGPDIYKLTGDTTAVLDATRPIKGKGKWSILSGIGGIIINDTLPDSEFHGVFGETYILNWTVSNTCGESSDKTGVVFSVPSPYDGDSNQYGKVIIGKQAWMNRNLKTSKYKDGSEISTNDYCWNKNDIINRDIYGGLYSWSAVETKNLCPDKWHVATKTDWEELIEYVGGAGVAGGKLKDINFWNEPNTGATNEYGFDGRPGGGWFVYNDGFGEFYMVGNYGNWWGYHEQDEQILPYRFILSTYRDYAILGGSKGPNDKYSVRCMCNRIPTVKTIHVSGISLTRANSGGIIISDGESEINEKGIVYGVNEYPTIEDSVVYDTSEFDNFSTSITSLKVGTRYFVRAFATNEMGIGYGNQLSFVASDTIPRLPVVITDTVFSNSSHYINAKGTIVSDEGSSIIEGGFVWSTSSYPTIYDSIIILNKMSDSNAGIGIMDSEISDVEIQTNYFIRAFATNALGTSYGQQFEIEPLSVTDIDGNIYTVHNKGYITEFFTYSDVSMTGIRGKVNDGKLIYMEQNLKTTHYNDGTSIPIVEDKDEWISLNTPAYCWFNNDSSNKDSLGALYNNFVVITDKICPVGWTVSDLGEPAYSNGNAINFPSGNRSYFNGKFYQYGGSWLYSSYPSTNFASSNWVGDDPNWTGAYRGYDRVREGLAIQCKKGERTIKKPYVISELILNITDSSAIVKSNLLSDGGLEITEMGICWDTLSAPTIDDNIMNFEAFFGEGEFICQMDSLSHTKQYYIRAFARNSLGISYSNQLTFRTIGLPELTTENISEISDTSALCYGTITYNGGDSITEYGFCWSTLENPGINDSLVLSTDSLEKFSVFIEDLNGNTTYYVRAFAKNNYGVAYGIQKSFITIGLCEIDTVEISNISDTSAFCSVDVNKDWGYPILEYGFCYSENENPTIDSNKVICNNLTNSFSGTLDNLSENTKYYVRSYIVNSLGISYGNQISFNTIGPVVKTLLAHHVYDSLATCKGKITLYVSPVLERGFFWSTTSDPNEDDHKIISNDTTLQFTVQLSDLEFGSTYYIAAYAKTKNGITLGNVVGMKCGELASFVDLRDGQTYKLVQIGNQGWMSKNLNYAFAGHSANSPDRNKYGLLYENIAAVCPSGLHLPSIYEWTELVNYLGGTDKAGGKLKGYSYWYSPNTGATNESGFNALPTGRLWFQFIDEGKAAYFIGSSETGFKEISLWYDSESVLIVDSYNSYRSVRCVVDD